VIGLATTSGGRCSFVGGKRRVCFKGDLRLRRGVKNSKSKIPLRRLNGRKKRNAVPEGLKWRGGGGNKTTDNGI